MTFVKHKNSVNKLPPFKTILAANKTPIFSTIVGVGTHNTFTIKNSFKLERYPRKLVDYS